MPTRTTLSPGMRSAWSTPTRARSNSALAEFQRLLAANPDYTNGYFMAAQTLVRAERRDEARKMLQSGIECARRTRNQHAMAEMQGLLEEIEGE